MYTKDQLKAYMDALFAGAEANAAKLPFFGSAAKAAIYALQLQADQNFDGIYERLKTAAVVTVDAFFDALAAYFAGNPVALAVVALVKTLVDAQLAQQAAQALAA